VIRTTAHRLATGAVLLLLAAACAGGGGDGGGGGSLQPPGADLSGAWTVKETVNASCQGPSFPQSVTHAFTVTQSGNSVTFHDNVTGDTYVGTISGDAVTWSFSYPSGDGVLSGTFSGTVKADGNAVTGRATWTWTGATTCSGSTDVNAARNGWIPAAPQGLAARAGYRQVTLSWTAVDGAAAYDVYRSTVPGADVYGTIVYTAAAASTTITSRWLTNETAYYYVVKAVTAASAKSSASNEALATPSASFPRPATPTNVVATPGTGKILLSCEPVADATRYRFFMSTSSGQITTYDDTRNFSSLTTSSCSAISWPVTSGATAYFVVTAWNLDGESEPSSEVYATAQ
jgi:hypothetical protein